MKNPDPYGEKKSAKLKGGKVQPNSGRFWAAKGDFIVDEYLFDRKETIRSSYSLSLENWEKLYKDAVTIGKVPVLEIEFTISNNTLVVLSEETFRGLLRAATDGDKNSEEGTERKLGQSFRNNKEEIRHLFNSLKLKEFRGD